MTERERIEPSKVETDQTLVRGVLRYQETRQQGTTMECPICKTEYIGCPANLQLERDQLKTERDQLRLDLKELTKNVWELAAKLGKEHTELESSRLALQESQQRVKELEYDYELVENEVTFEVNRDRLGPTEDLPQTIKRIIQQRDSAKQRVAELEHANNSWIYENEKWKEQRDKQQTALQELAEALREIIRWSPKAFPDGIAYRNAKKLADAALAKAAPLLPKEGE